jgi:hypothetical protein
MAGSHKAFAYFRRTCTRNGILDLKDKGKGLVFCITVKIKGKSYGTPYSVIYVNLFVRVIKGEGMKSNILLKGGQLD